MHWQVSVCGPVVPARSDLWLRSRDSGIRVPSSKILTSRPSEILLPGDLDVGLSECPQISTALLLLVPSGQISKQDFTKS